MSAPWPTGHPPFTARSVKATTPSWLYTLLSLPADVRVLTLNTALIALFSAPTSAFTVTSRIPLPASIYGPTARLPPLKCRISALTTGSIRGAVISPGHITLVLHDDTKTDLYRAYSHFLHSPPMAHVSTRMKDVFRRNFRAAVDNASWRVGIEALRACDADGCANLKRHLAGFAVRSEEVSPRGRGRPRKQLDECPVGLREMVEGVVDEVKGFFAPSLPGEKGVKVSMWRVKWRVPGGGGGKIGSPGGSPQERSRVVVDLTAEEDMDMDTTKGAPIPGSDVPTTTEQAPATNGDTAPKVPTPSFQEHPAACRKS